MFVLRRARLVPGSAANNHAASLYSRRLVIETDGDVTAAT